MGDPRVRNLARILVDYSLAVRHGWTVSVDATAAAEPLVEAAFEALLRKGAFPVVRMMPARAEELFFTCGKPHHFRTVPSHARAHVRCCDAFLRIKSEANTRALTRCDAAKQALLIKTMKPVRDVIRRKPWVLTLFPTEAYAQDAEMSLRAFEDFVYGAAFADEDDPVGAWRSFRREQARLIRRLRGADDIRIEGPGTDLRLSVKGRVFVNSDGRRNMPSGEIFTGPVEHSAEGTIVYDYPVCYSGREIDGIRLVFRRGVVVEASARKNEAFLRAMLKSDPGAKRLGELGIGTNRKIQRFTKSILFDEKIGGTVHLALGQSYPETGGKNRSAIHWDMIKDLRDEGRMTVNGRVFLENGRFI
jgi:aminopeptidase